MTDLGPSIRAAILANAAITSKLVTWQGEPAVFTRRPIPADSGYPCIAISPDISYGDQDFINSPLSVIMRDVVVYGQQPNDYRAVEQMAYELREMFHRKPWSLGNTPFHVVSINTSGPYIAATEQYASNLPSLLGRVVTLTMRVQ